MKARKKADEQRVSEAIREFNGRAQPAYFPDGSLNCEALDQCSLVDLVAWRERELGMLVHASWVIRELRGLTIGELKATLSDLEYRLDKECDARCHFLGYLLAEIDERKQSDVN